MLWSVRSLLTLVFVGLSAFSTARMALATHNYLEFFPAMDNLMARVASIEVRPDLDLIRVLFVVVNPTGYSGLGFSSFQVALTFQNGTSKIPYGAIQSSAEGPLPPHGELSIPGIVHTSGYWTRPAELLSQGKLVALFQVSMSLTTLLDSVAEIIVHLDCPTILSPVDCQRSGVEVTSARYTGGGV